jgi:hypothetical protein
MARRHVLRDGGVPMVAAGTQMSDERRFARPSERSQRHAAAVAPRPRCGHSHRDTVEMALELDIVVNADPADAPFGKAIGLRWQRLELGPVELLERNVKRHAIGTPDRHRKRTPHGRWGRLVPVANRRVPRVAQCLTSDGAARVGGACLPTGASRGGTQARCLKRQLSLPVSMISQ